MPSSMSAQLRGRIARSSPASRKCPTPLLRRHSKPLSDVVSHSERSVTVTVARRVGSRARRTLNRCVPKLGTCTVSMNC